MSVWVGEVDLDSDPSDGLVFEMLNWQMIRHPKYVEGQMYYDVAMIFLDKRLDFDDRVRPICLPDAPRPDPDTRREEHASIIGKVAMSLLLFTDTFHFEIGS